MLRKYIKLKYYLFPYPLFR